MATSTVHACIESLRLRTVCRLIHGPSNPLIPQEKINYFWIVEKKTLEDKKAELRNKERELQVREYRAPEGIGQEGLNSLSRGVSHPGHSLILGIFYVVIQPAGPGGET